MFGLFGSQIEYKTAHSETIKSQDITTDDQLVNYILGVNSDLFDKEEKGILLVQKNKVTKKGTTPLFGIRLELPILEDNEVIIEKLTPFYSKKAVPFEPISFDEDLTVSTDTTQSGMPEHLEKLKGKGQALLEKETIVETEVSIDLPNEEQAVESTPNTQKELENLRRLVQQQHEQIKQLNEVKVVTENDTNSTTSQTVSDDVSKEETVVSQQSTVDLKDVTPPSVDTRFDEGLLAQPTDTLIKQALDSRLAQLAEEVATRDTRESIKTAIRDKYQKEKDRRITEEVAQLEAKKATSMQQAKKDYEKRLADIETAFFSEKTDKITAITSSVEVACQEEITKACDKQTKELEVFVSQKKQEILSWTADINSSIDGSFLQLKSTLELEKM